MAPRGAPEHRSKKRSVPRAGQRLVGGIAAGGHQRGASGAVIADVRRE